MVRASEGIDTGCLSFRSASEAVPGFMTFISIGTAMLGALMFGIDVVNFGTITGFRNFQDHWCVDMGWGYPTENPCKTDDGTKITTGECSLGPGCYAATGPTKYYFIFICAGNVLIMVGAALASICFAGRVADKYGRRMCIFAGALTVTLGCGLTVLSGSLPFQRPDELPASPTLNWFPIYAFYFSRLVTGTGVGLCTYALPIYNTEVATPGIRGRMGGLFQFFTAVGQWTAGIATLQFHGWQVGMMLPAVASTMVALIIWLVPESPRWVLKTKGPEAAVQILQRLRSGDVQAELAAIQEGINEEKDLVQISYRDLFKTGLRQRVFVACFMQVAQQMTGVNAILGLSASFFVGMGMSSDYTSVFNNYFQTVAVVFCVIGLVFVDSSFGGRRIQLMVAASVMGCSALLAAATLHSVPWQVGAAMLCVYMAGFQFAWGIVPWVYPSEIFTMNERITAMSLAVFVQYTVNGVIYIVSPIMVLTSMRFTLYFFGSSSLLGLVFICACIKETKGVPLEMVPQLFSRHEALSKKDVSMA